MEKMAEYNHNCSSGCSKCKYCHHCTSEISHAWYCAKWAKVYDESKDEYDWYK